MTTKIFWKDSEPILLCEKSETEDNEWTVVNGAWTLIMISELEGYCKSYPETNFKFSKITDTPKGVKGDYNEILKEARRLRDEE